MQAYIQEQPRTGVELRAKMEEFSPGMGKQHLADAVRMHLALIQPLPAGTWGFTGRPAFNNQSLSSRSVVTRGPSISPRPLDESAAPTTSHQWLSE